MTVRISPVTASDTPEASRPLLAKLQAAFGRVPNLFATIARSPAALEAYLSFDGALRKGGLSAREAEAIDLHVSELDGCGYCLSAHAALGKRAGMSAEEIERAREGVSNDPRTSALLALARRVVRTGGGGAAAEVARAKELGVSDAEILETLARVAGKIFTNAAGLVAQTEIDFPKVDRLPNP